MCFTLYAGTAHRVPRSAFDWNAPNLNVVSLTEHDAPIRKHFSQPEVQYIGSTSCCGCDFPHAILHNGAWHAPAEAEAGHLATHQRNMEALVALLHASGDPDVELYGIWSGDVVTAPRLIENVSIEQLLEAGFHFKERGFYRVVIESNAAPRPHGRWTRKLKKKKKSPASGSTDAILDSLRRKRAERAAAPPDATPAAPVQTSSPDEEDEAPPLPAPGLRLTAVNYVPVKKP